MELTFWLRMEGFSFQSISRWSAVDRQAYLDFAADEIDRQLGSAWNSPLVSAGFVPFDGALEVSFEWFLNDYGLPRGLTHELNVGDLDNVCKSLLDRFQSRAFKDDKQIVRLVMSKRSIKAINLSEPSRTPTRIMQALRGVKDHSTDLLYFRVSQLETHL